MHFSHFTVTSSYYFFWYLASQSQEVNQNPKMTPSGQLQAGPSPCPAQPHALGYGNKVSVRCCNQAVCHSPRLCIQRVPWTRIFNLAKKKQQPRSHCCLFSHFSPHPNQRPSGLVCPTARKTYRALCTAAFLAEHKTP